MKHMYYTYILAVFFVPSSCIIHYPRATTHTIFDPSDKKIEELHALDYILSSSHFTISTERILFRGFPL
jgi:hypothetical protein